MVLAMAGKSGTRIVYLLALDRAGRLECNVHTTKVMKWDAFSEMPVDFRKLFQKQYADALDATDRTIGMRLMQNSRPDAPDTAVLDGPEGHDLVRTMIETGRGFWRTGSHLRLGWDEIPMPVRPLWRSDADRHTPVLRPASACAMTSAGSSACRRRACSRPRSARLVAWEPQFGTVEVSLT